MHKTPCKADHVEDRQKTDERWLYSLEGNLRSLPVRTTEANGGVLQWNPMDVSAERKYVIMAQVYSIFEDYSRLEDDMNRVIK